MTACQTATSSSALAVSAGGSGSQLGDGHVVVRGDQRLDSDDPHHPSVLIADRRVPDAVEALAAHNLIRWTAAARRARLAPTGEREDVPAQAADHPGRLTRTARRFTLHLPARWPWQYVFEDTLGRLRPLPAPM
jgi:hypothetical protein